MKLNYKLCIW